MPHKEQNHISVVELHPTFAAEVRGVDFSQELSIEVFDEIYHAITKVSHNIRRCHEAEHSTRRRSTES